MPVVDFDDAFFVQFVTEVFENGEEGQIVDLRWSLLVLSDQLIRWCCIDRLSSQPLPDRYPPVLPSWPFHWKTRSRFYGLKIATRFCCLRRSKVLRKSTHSLGHLLAAAPVLLHFQGKLSVAASQPGHDGEQAASRICRWTVKSSSHLRLYR
jgi:hypothetical protein